jgi:nucleoside-diphosphate-sugar epimerase
MNIVITGGAGFLGARLARQLLELGQAFPCRRRAANHQDRDPGRPGRTPRRVDGGPTQFAPWSATSTSFLRARASQVVRADDTLVFHLAAAVSGECEADFDLGMRSNVDATRALLQACRALGTSPTVVFASSLAVFGNSAAQPLPPVIDDRTLPTPQNSYGIQKFIGEQLVADYARKGFIRGRNVRLMTVSVQARQAQWRGVELFERHDPRAAGGCAGRMPGAARNGSSPGLSRANHRRVCCARPRPAMPSGVHARPSTCPR